MRLLIVDDHEDFRRVAGAALAAGGWELVGEAVDGETALAASADLRPEVVLLDVHLPDRDGIDVAWRIASRPAAPVVVLTSSRPRRDFGARLLAAPAAGFLAKDDLTAASLRDLVAQASGCGAGLPRR